MSKDKERKTTNGWVLIQDARADAGTTFIVIDCSSMLIRRTRDGY